MKKKISIAVGFGILAILAVAVIIMASIQVNYKPQIANPTVISITNANSKNITLTEEENEKIYNEVLTQFENSFTRSYLSALFAGQTSNENDAIQTNNLENFNSYKVVFNYSNNPQDLTINGETKPQKYSQIIFGVSDFEGYQKINVYFKHSTSSTVYYLLETFTSQSNFFDYLENIEDYK